MDKTSKPDQKKKDTSPQNVVDHPTKKRQTDLQNAIHNASLGKDDGVTPGIIYEFTGYAGGIKVEQFEKKPQHIINMMKSQADFSEYEMCGGMMIPFADTGHVIVMMNETQDAVLKHSHGEVESEDPHE